MDILGLIEFIGRTIEWGGRKALRAIMNVRDNGGGRWDMERMGMGNLGWQNKRQGMQDMGIGKSSAENMYVDVLD